MNSGNFKEAFNYAKKLEKQKLDNFESNLILGVFYLKNYNTELSSRNIFLKLKIKNQVLF